MKPVKPEPQCPDCNGTGWFEETGFGFFNYPRPCAFRDHIPTHLVYHGYTWPWSQEEVEKYYGKEGEETCSTSD